MNIYKPKGIHEMYIFGASSRARTLKEYMSVLYPDTPIEAFLVDDSGENEEYLDGIQVCILSEMQNIDKTVPVYIATRGVYHEKIKKVLQSRGMQCIIPVTVELDIKLRNEYLRKHFHEHGRAWVTIDDICADDEGITENNKTAGIYVAHSIYDKPLQSKYELTKDERLIQVGAALTKERISEGVLTDCEGDNISSKNRQYCELTGIYWIWKHAAEDYLGLAHYRRHFLLPSDWVKRMEQYGIDVILPVPLYVSPNLEDNFKSRHIADDWDFMMMYFKEKMPDKYERIKEILHGSLYSPCNMFVIRRDVLNDLCQWLFPILNAVVEHGGEKEDAYMNRYPGFISERLITLFFELNREKYKVVYANKNFIN